MERGAMRRPGIVAYSAIAAAVFAGAVMVWGANHRRDTALQPARPRVQIPAGVRIRVEVLNATPIRGLARGAMHYLRDQGFDVVYIGTSREQRDSTLVLDRSGHPEWARLVGTALGGAAVESRPDSSRYLDVTVLLGASWRPPTEPLHP
jgi:hypothetical protein